MWWWLLTIVFFLMSLSSITLLYFALKRINQYESFLINFQQIIEFSTEKMKLVDSKGHYESDDETGFFFQQLKQIQELLDGVFENETEENSGGEEKS